MGVTIYMVEPFPRDDFLRHVRHIDYAPLGGYAYMFPDSFFEKITVNPWHGFDVIAGQIKTAIGEHNTAIAFEIAFMLLMIVAFLVNFKYPAHLAIPAACIALVAISSGLIYRVSLVRPTILMSILFLFGIKGKGAITGVIGTLFAAFTYYLFWLFSVPLAIAHYFKGDKKFAVSVAVSTVIGILAWIALSNGEYIKLIYKLFMALFFERDGNSIGENRPLFELIVSHAVFIWMALLALTIANREKFDIYALLMAVTAPIALQARYFLDISLPLAVIYVTVHNKDIIEKIYEKNIKLAQIICISSLVLLSEPLTILSSKNGDMLKMTGIDIEQGSKVMTAGLQAMFKVVYYNKTPIRVYPSCEIGWNDTETKKINKDTTDSQKIDNSICGFLESKGMDYLVTELYVEADCLKLKKRFDNKTALAYSLWEVKKSKR